MHFFAIKLCWNYQSFLWCKFVIQQAKKCFKVSFGVVKWFTGYRKTFNSSTCLNHMKLHMIWNSWKKGSYLEMLDDLFAFEKKRGDYFWRSRMICWLSNNLGAGREKVEASDLQFFQLWDLFSKYFSSEILIERYTRKWKFLHLTKGKSQGVKCQSSQGLQNRSFLVPIHPSRHKICCMCFGFLFFFAILIYDLQISSLYKVVKQYRWAD